MVITFALEPIGVAFPPKPQPIAKAQYRGIISTSATPVIGSLLNSPISSITGNIAAQKGILSTMADAIAETQMRTITNTTGLLCIVPSGPKLSNIILAIASRYPIASSPPTITNNPAKNKSAPHSTLCTTSWMSIRFSSGTPSILIDIAIPAPPRDTAEISKSKCKSSTAANITTVTAKAPKVLYIKVSFFTASHSSSLVTSSTF